MKTHESVEISEKTLLYLSIAGLCYASSIFYGEHKRQHERDQWQVYKVQGNHLEAIVDEKYKEAYQLFKEKPRKNVQGLHDGRYVVLVKQKQTNKEYIHTFQCMNVWDNKITAVCPNTGTYTISASR